MTKGMARRAGTQDNLAGNKDVQPVTLQGPGVRAPSAPVPNVANSMQARVASQLGQWSSGKLQEAVNKQQEKDHLEGQMAYQQGKAFEDVQMGGNKFALEGYRFMDAQTISSSLLAAQREEINSGAYSMDPDAYRKQYVGRLDAALEGVDPRTGELVREQMTRQMPTLVADHTAAHMRHQEQQNFDSLERSIDVISRDPTATDELVSFARGGEGSASYGLSDERRQAAVVSGVVRAFENDNPLAYSALASEGVLGDNLSTEEMRAVRSAQKAFENRRRSEYDKSLFDGEQALMLQVEQAEISPQEAVEQLSILYADHDINMNAAEAGAIYSAAQTSERVENRTQATLYEDARLRGDYDTMARITEPIMVQRESGGNPNAVSPAGAKGTHQVMDGTNLDPGFGVRPAQDNSAAERARVGSDYWRAMIERYDGDLEAAAIAYNAGPGNADNWLEAGRDYSALPKPEETKPYAKDIVGALEGWKAPTPQDRLRIAQDRLVETRDRLAMDTYENMAPQLADLDNQFRRGEISENYWRGARKATYEEYEVARTQADVNHEINTATGVENAVIAKRDKLVEEAAEENRVLRLEAAHAELLGARAQYESVVGEASSSPEQIAAATREFSKARQQVFDDYDIAVADRGNQKANEQMYTRASEAIDRNKVYTEEQVQIDAAVAGGYLDGLPKNLQRRAFDQFQQRTVQHYNDAVGAGQISEEEANMGIAADMNAFYAESGQVDPRVAMRMSAAVLGPLIDKEGNPNPNVVDAVTQYAEVREMNPRAAEKFLDPTAMVRAEAVLARADDPSLIGESVRNLGIELDGNPRVENTTEYMARDDVQEAISRETTHFLEERDIGILHALWQGDADLDQYQDTRASDTDRIWSEETRGRLQTELEQEVSRLQRIQPNLKPRDLVGKAAERLTRRTEIIGGDLVMLQPGQDIAASFFGGRANEFTQDGAVNSAVMEWLRSPEAQEEYSFISGVAEGENLPGWVQNAADMAAGIFGGSYDPAMSMREAQSTRRTGVRPFRSYPTADGKGIVLEVLKPDGNYSEPIAVPARKAGEMYMQRRLREMTE